MKTKKIENLDQWFSEVFESSNLSILVFVDSQDSVSQKQIGILKSWENMKVQICYICDVYESCDVAMKCRASITPTVMIYGVKQKLFESITFTDLKTLDDAIEMFG